MNNYYVRAFCKSKKMLYDSDLEKELKQLDSTVCVKKNEINVYGHHCDYMHVFYHVFYNQEKHPIIVAVEYNEGIRSLAGDELIWFIDKIGSPGYSFSKRYVISHLNKCEYIISCRMLGDMDKFGYAVIRHMLDFLVRNYGALVYVENEGFYKNNKLIVDVE